MSAESVRTGRDAPPDDVQPLYSPKDRARTAEQARRPIQTSKPKEDR
ncbi:hypothetical protein AB0K60_07145 [Thermopolyspora sp. NPDC052614]